MTDIVITKPVQFLLTLAVLVAVAVLSLASLPELQRYLKIRAM
ncbi:MAG TPA: hypothetical protein VH025_01105 [Solirubrobacteraceae bacterium]|jgi:hypothetical protein|nr:hypothetical protein [Solirubrobacteraceae bacterium]